MRGKVKYKELGCRERWVEMACGRKRYWQRLVGFFQSVNKLKAEILNSGAPLCDNQCDNQCDKWCNHVASMCKFKLDAVALVHGCLVAEFKYTLGLCTGTMQGYLPLACKG